MALQIANPTVVAKVAELAALTGLSKTAAVEKAVDEMLRTSVSVSADERKAKIYALLAQFDRIPPEPHPESDIVWDEHGLPT